MAQKSLAEINEFNEFISKFGFQDALNELLQQCGHFADFADDHEQVSQADGWAECCDYLRQVHGAAVHYNLQWPKKPD